jgi:hypothetical protein
MPATSAQPSLRCRHHEDAVKLVSILVDHRLQEPFVSLRRLHGLRGTTESIRLGRPLSCRSVHRAFNDGVVLLPAAGSGRNYNSAGVGYPRVAPSDPQVTAACTCRSASPPAGEARRYRHGTEGFGGVEPTWGCLASSPPNSSTDLPMSHATRPAPPPASVHRRRQRGSRQGNRI